VLAGTPQPVIDRLAKELTASWRARREGEIRQDRPAGGGRGPGAFLKRVAARGADVQGVIDKAGLKIQ
jgi:hypothetical protein